MPAADAWDIELLLAVHGLPWESNEEGSSSTARIHTFGAAGRASFIYATCASRTRGGATQGLHA